MLTTSVAGNAWPVSQRRQFTGQHVTRFLGRVIETYGKPRQILADNGPDFAGNALSEWTYANKIEHLFIDPGKRSRMLTFGFVMMWTKARNMVYDIIIW